MELRYKYTVVILLAAVMATITVFDMPSSEPSREPIAHAEIVSEVPTPRVAGVSTSTIKPEPELLMPISVGLTRVTKKPFGLQVSPYNSPVDNDIFTGFHTGIDFEVFPSEENIDVPVTAACDGKILIKTWAKGYGGLLVQACKIDEEDVTIIYGHIKLESVRATVGQTLQAGDLIGLLGESGSHDTDGRRKHLHFDIHKGSEIDVRGYVPVHDDLVEWIDPVQHLE